MFSAGNLDMRARACGLLESSKVRTRECARLRERRRDRGSAGELELWACVGACGRVSSTNKSSQTEACARLAKSIAK
jgi:hypothetical protein